MSFDQKLLTLYACMSALLIMFGWSTVKRRNCGCQQQRGKRGKRSGARRLADTDGSADPAVETFVIEESIRKDGRDWHVQSAESIPVLAEMIRRINVLIEEVRAHPPAGCSTARLRPWDETFVSENKLNSWRYHSTAYSVNKGDELVFCLRDRENNRLHDVNTMMFVAIHELAHIVTDEHNHTELFWRNMRTLLQIAERLGLYTAVDYARNPVEYCGVTIDRAT